MEGIKSEDIELGILKKKPQIHILYFSNMGERWGKRIDYEVKPVFLTKEEDLEHALLLFIQRAKAAVYELRDNIKSGKVKLFEE